MVYRAITDQAMADARRQLDPVWDERRNRFDQQMVSRGFAPGTEGYDRAYSNLERAASDAYSGAAFDALQYGANRMDADRAFGEGRRRYDQDFGEGRRRYNQQFRDSTNRFDRTLGEQQRQFDEGTRRYDQGFTEDVRRSDRGFGEDTRRFDLGFGEGQRRFDLGFGEDMYQDRRDFGENRRRYDQEFGLNELQILDNISRAYSDQAYRDAVFNASREDQQMSALMSMLGFAPVGGAQPFNMGSAFNSSMLGDLAGQQWESGRNQNLIDALMSAKDIDWGSLFS